MKGPIETRVDITGNTRLPGRLSTAVSIFLPEQAEEEPPPVVVVAFPGGGFSRRYYDIQLNSATGYSQAEHHTRHGIVFIACDHLGVGDSDIPDLNALSFEDLAAANHATVKGVMSLLEEGSLAEGVGPFHQAVVIGIGQSMGGCLLTVLQARYRPFDAVAFLGWSGIHTEPPRPPRLHTAHLRMPTRGTDAKVALTFIQESPPPLTAAGTSYHHHWDDVLPEVLERDGAGKIPLAPWRSPTMPGCAATMLSAGVVAEEAAWIDVPVFIGVGERDVCPNPHAEPGAYPNSPYVTLCKVPRMGHMHNFASTRAILWGRLVHWASGIRSTGTD
jgi:pimeloyl-ACP methyl ester carboxylesterase